jgi:hypothetical protein
VTGYRCRLRGGDSSRGGSIGPSDCTYRSHRHHDHGRENPGLWGTIYLQIQGVEGENGASPGGRKNSEQAPRHCLESNWGEEIWVKDGLRQAKDDTFGELIPAFQFRFWKEDASNGPGTGKTVSCRYSQEDPSFQDPWEII